MMKTAPRRSVRLLSRRCSVVSGECGRYLPRQPRDRGSYQGMRLRRYPDRLKTDAIAADNTAREQRGRPFRTGLSGNPAGRPPGSRNRATLAAEAKSMSSIASEKTGQKQEGRRLFVSGRSGNPAGRPRGARNKATMAAEILLDGEAEAITRKAVEKAKQGDAGALAALPRAHPAAAQGSPCGVQVSRRYDHGRCH